MSLADLIARNAALQAGGQSPALPSDPVVLTSQMSAAINAALAPAALITKLNTAASSFPTTRPGTSNQWYRDGGYVGITE